MTTGWRPFLSGISLAAAACAPQMGTAEAEAEIARFRQLYQREQFAQIYATAGEEFRAASPAHQFTRFLSLIRKRFGNVRRSNQAGWHTNFTPVGTLVVLNYDTEFERGRAMEQFTLKLNDGAAQLVGYQVNSPELMNELLEQSIAKDEGEAASPPGEATVPVRMVPITRAKD